MNDKKIGNLVTEARNPRTMNLDKMSTEEAVRVFMTEERRAVEACIESSNQLAKAVDLYVDVLKSGGKIIQTGSGCSGDFAQLDVLELEATFGQDSEGDIEKDKIFGLHTQKGWYANAENLELLEKSYKENINRDMSEDSLEQPKKDLDYIKFKKGDLLICITASGRSPAIVKLAKEAKKRKGFVISLVMNKNTEIKEFSDVTVEAVVGQPPLTGSGRTLAGTASKILITTLSSIAHVKMGAVYSNLMVNLKVKKWLDNSKFIDRSIRIIKDVTGKDLELCKNALIESDYDIKVACVMIAKSVEKEKAKNILEEVKGFLNKAI